MEETRIYEEKGVQVAACSPECSTWVLKLISASPVTGFVCVSMWRRRLACEYYLAPVGVFWGSCHMSQAYRMVDWSS